MKARFTALALALVLVAGSVAAADTQTVLAPDGTFYSIDGGRREQSFLGLSRSKGEVRETLLVPNTDDLAVESDARLLWDSATSMLFVIWHSADAANDAVVIATLDAEGTWSEPAVLASCSSMRRAGLQTMLTHARIDEETGEQATLVHVAWWGVGSELTAEYALVAYERGQRVSTEVAKLDQLAERNKTEEADEYEDTGAAVHPPLAVARADKGAVDVVYGDANTTKITRLRVDPTRVKGDARLWRPLGRGTGRTDPARLIADSTAPLQAFISRGRIVLYEPNQKFRFVVLENGVWSPERMIAADDHLTSDQLLDALRRTVDEHSATDGLGKEQK